MYRTSIVRAMSSPDYLLFLSESMMEIINKLYLLALNRKKCKKECSKTKSVAFITSTSYIYYDAVGTFDNVLNSDSRLDKSWEG